MNLAVIHIDGSGWTGGTVYLKNLLAALRALEKAKRPRVRLLTPEGTDPSSYASLTPYLDGILMRPGYGKRRSLTARVWNRLRREKRQNRLVGPYLQANGVDCVFGTENFGPGFEVPLLSWLCDFQHLHRPEMFSTTEIEQRDQFFTDAAEQAARIIVSSQDALRDFERFSPSQAHKGRVLTFVAQVPSNVHDGDPRWVCEEYNLPERYFYLPNQFWKHKNHEVVIQALATLKRQNSDITVVCTGHTHDSRHSGHFASLLTEISRQSLRDRMIILGLVPHAHTFQLMRQSLAVLQPSLFEGWSTTVEEAKSVGKPILISTLPVHCEQNPPEAIFFDPNDADALAQAMQSLSQGLPGPSQHLEEKARQELGQRTHIFGKTFLSIAGEVVTRKT